MTLFANEPDAFDSQAASLAAVFAAHAALALTSVREIRTLRAMAASRGVIGQAQGKLMQLHGISADEAFEMLVLASQHSNIKLRELCAEFACSGQLPAGVNGRSVPASAVR